MQHSSILLLFSFLVQAQALRRAGESPIHQVVELLTELKGNIEADGESEQKAYDKYACWCEETLAAKVSEISAGKQSIEDLGKSILKLKANLGVHDADKRQLTKDIAANLESQRAAEEVREKEKATYEEEKVEQEQCIGALEAAIKVLTGAGTGKKAGFLENLQEAQLLSVVAGVRSVVERREASKSVSGDDLALVRRFLDRPDEFVGSRTGALSAAQIASNPFGDFAPQSGQVQGVLKSMYDAFTADLERGNADEAKKVKVFEELMQTKSSELTTLQNTLESVSMDEATKTKKLADDRLDRDIAKDTLKADEKFFADTKEACKAKAAEWSERTRLRTEELHGIADALAILSDPEALETFENSSSAAALIQVSAGGAGSRGRAYEVLRDVATRTRSLRLARIAAEVRTAGHFDGVIVAIDKMLRLLRQEAKDDVARRDRCERETQENTNNLDDLNFALDKAGQDIKRMKAEVKELETKVGDIDDDINATAKSQEEMRKARIEEADDALRAHRDDLAAIQLLDSAIHALSRFFKKNRRNLLQLGTRDEPSATPPTTGWSGTKGNHEGAHANIISLLELIKEDIEKEIRFAKQTDSAAQKNYESDVSALQETREEHEKSKTLAKKQIAKLRTKIGSREGHEMRTNSSLNEENDIKESLETDCAWVEHFESRRSEREAEMKGLVEAKHYLAAQSVEADGSSLPGFF